MSKKLSKEAIGKLGFAWPRYELIAQYCVAEGEKIDLEGTAGRLRARRAYFRQQLDDAYAFKMKYGADYADFTDRRDDDASMYHALGNAIAYLEQIMAAADCA